MCPKLGCKSTRSIALRAVETCSKAVLAHSARHGKSPCFLRCGFLKLFGADGTVLVSASVDVGDFLECAF